MLQLRLWALVGGILFATGCGGGEGPRAAVHGKVTWDGKPVSEGSIRFQPANAPAVLGPIKDGAYSLSGASRVPLGTAKVAIEAFVPDGEIVLGAGKAPEKKLKQVLPRKYNEETSLTAEIQAGDNEKNFDLKP